MPYIADEPAPAPSCQEPKPSSPKPIDVATWERLARDVFEAADTEQKPREKLYQLPISGDWITLSRVTDSHAHPGRGEHPPAATVVCSRPAGGFGGDGSSYHTIKCETYEQACEIRDEIAKARNAL